MCVLGVLGIKPRALRMQGKSCTLVHIPSLAHKIETYDLTQWFSTRGDFVPWVETKGTAAQVTMHREAPQHSPWRFTWLRILTVPRQKNPALMTTVWREPQGHIAHTKEPCWPPAHLEFPRLFACLSKDDSIQTFLPHVYVFVFLFENKQEVLSIKVQFM